MDARTTAMETKLDVLINSRGALANWPRTKFLVSLFKVVAGPAADVFQWISFISDAVHGRMFGVVFVVAVFVDADPVAAAHQAAVDQWIQQSEQSFWKS